MIYKTFVIVALIFAGDFVVGHIRDGYSMGSVIPPEKELREASLQLGGWQGRDLPADARIREILRARSGIDRVYQNEDGEQVLVHAVWTDDYLKLHFPQQCYRLSGWAEESIEEVALKPTASVTVPAKLLTFEQDGRMIRVLYWFQFGEHVFLDRVQHRLLRRKVCWGQTEWPPLMKFMLETSDDGSGTADQRLIDVAERLYREIHGPGASPGEQAVKS
jgi:EpsI family protein